MKALFAVVLLLSLQVSYAQISNDWVVPIREDYLGYGLGTSFMRGPEVVVDAHGLIYHCGFAGGWSNYELLLGEEGIVADGNRYTSYYLAQIDSMGQGRWLAKFSGWQAGGYNYYQRPYIVPRPGGGVTLVSMVNYTVAYRNDTLAQVDFPHLLIAQLDPDGSLANYELIEADVRQLTSVSTAIDGDILIAGHYRDFHGRLGNHAISSTTSPSYFLARLSTDGTVKWLRNLAPQVYWRTVGDAFIRELADGRIAVVLSPGGYNYVIQGCPEDPYYLVLATFDGQRGDRLLTKEIATLDFGHMMDMVQWDNGDLYLVGGFGGRLRSEQGEQYTVTLTNCNTMKGFVMKLTSEGSVYDVEVSPGGFVGHRIIPLSGNRYLLTGRIASKGWPTTDFEEDEHGFAAKVYDSRGRLLHAQRLTRDYGQERMMIDATALSPHSVVVAGRLIGPFMAYPSNYGFPGGAVFTAKLDLHLGASDIGPSPIQASEVTLFPNPTSGTLNVNLGGGFFAQEAISIYDAFGRQVYAHPALGVRNQFTFDLAHLPAGVYVLRIGERESMNFKFVKQ